jgi:Lipocalin-like domain
MSRLTAIALCTLFCLATAAQAQTGNPLAGAWRVSEIAETGKPPLTDPQPGLYIFTLKHYSFMRISSAKPLPDYPSNDKASDADKVTVFNSLYLQSGSYSIKNNVLVIDKVVVAKSAFAMAGAGNRFDIAQSGDTLTLTQLPNGPAIKLVRME